MQLRNIILAGVAIAAFGATAATAASYNDSTPAEKAQTRQLNRQALGNAQGVPAGQTPTIAGAPVAPVNSPAVQSSPDVVAQPDTLAAMTNPPARMANANVMSADGDTVGLVQKIQLDASGKPVRLDIALKENGKTISLDPHMTTYDAIDNVVIASSTHEEITKMSGTLPQG